MRDLLLYLALVDLREFSDDELRDYLSLMLGSLQHPQPPLSGEEADSARALREQILLQMEAEAPDRKEVSGWYEDYPGLLPESVSDLEERLAEFDEFLEVLFEDEEIETDQRLERFRRCLELLDQDWQQRSLAARGLATLEEELFVYRDAYLALPKSLPACTSISLITHMNLMEGFDIWQAAFRLVHQGELDEALDTAFEGTCLFHATERWPQRMAQRVPTQ